MLLFKAGKGIESAAENGFTPYATRILRFVAIIPSGHTFATEAIRAGVDVETVSKTLGHFSVGFTLDVYGHVTQEMKEEAARRIQESINRRAMG